MRISKRNSLKKENKLVIQTMVKLMSLTQAGTQTDIGFKRKIIRQNDIDIDHSECSQAFFNQVLN